MRPLTLLLLALFISTIAFSQRSEDKIIGIYKAEKDNRHSKVKIFKHENGYRAQIIWLAETKNPDGSLRTDLKNPNPNKRSTPSDQIVLIEKVIYDNGIWTNGKIYDPTSGKNYKVELYFETPNILTVKGKLGPFFKRVYWKKIQ